MNVIFMLKRYIYRHVNPGVQLWASLDPAYRSVDVHRVHISEAGSNLHPVLVDPQQIFFSYIHRQTSKKMDTIRNRNMLQYFMKDVYSDKNGD